MNPDQTEFVFDSYKLFEEKLVSIFGIFPLSKENDKAWSPELVSLFVEIGSLVDSLSRTLLGGSPSLNIINFENKLFKPTDLLDSNIIVYTYPLRVMTPFSGYRNQHDGWWSVYNKLKHNRVENYERANLSNVVKALGGLFLLLTRYKDEEFSKALHRRQWTKANGVVPEYVHAERLSCPGLFWCDSSLFGGSDSPKFIPQDLSKINPALTSSKFQRYFGRFNP